AAISPSSPGPNLAWSFNPANGSLSIVSLPPPQITQVGLGPGNTFAISGTGPAGQAYRILAATNLAMPINAWAEAGTGIFNGGVFSFTDDMATNFPQRFYRAVTP
ncbi:MAG: hypothetical protein ACTHKU_09235, partial [Verrucomicrobiota bacterium]